MLNVLIKAKNDAAVKKAKIETSNTFLQLLVTYCFLNRSVILTVPTKILPRMPADAPSTTAAIIEGPNG